MTGRAPERQFSSSSIGIVVLSVLAFALRLHGLGAEPGLPIHGDEPPIVASAIHYWEGIVPSTLGAPAASYILVLGLAYALIFFIGHIAEVIHFLMTGDVLILANAADSFFSSSYRDPSVQYIAARVISACFGAASIPLIYLVARGMYGGRTALLAASLLTLAPLHVQYGHFALPETLTVLLVLCALHHMTRAIREDKPRSRNWAGFAVGLATGTKFSAALLLIPLALIGILRRREGDGAQPAAVRTETGRLALSIGCFGAGICVADPFFLAHLPQTVKEIVFVTVGRMAFGLGSEVPPSGRVGGLWNYVASILPQSIGLIPTLAAGFGAVILLKNRRAADLILLSCLLPYSLIMGGLVHPVDRFGMPNLPFLLIAAARFAAAVSNRAAPLLSGRTLRLAGAGTGIALLFADPAYRALRGNHLLTLPDPRPRALQWFQDYAPHGARVAMKVNGYTALLPLPRTAECLRRDLDRLRDPDATAIKYSRLRGRRYPSVALAPLLLTDERLMEREYEFLLREADAVDPNVKRFDVSLFTSGRPATPHIGEYAQTLADKQIRYVVWPGVIPELEPAVASFEGSTPIRIYDLINPPAEQPDPRG